MISRFLAAGIRPLCLLSLLLMGCSASITKQGVWIGPAGTPAAPSQAVRKPKPPASVPAPSVVTAPKMPPTPQPQKPVASVIPANKPAPKAAVSKPAPAPKAAVSKPAPAPKSEPALQASSPPVIPTNTRTDDAVVLHLSPTGDDGNLGTALSPFLSIARAQKAVRELKAQGVVTNIVIFLRDGTYRLDQPCLFTAEDGGTADHRVTYAAWPGERPILSGGRPITGWSSGRRGTWTAALPEVAAGDWWFRDLYVNGKRAQRARFPAATSTAGMRVASSTLGRERETWATALEKWEITVEPSLPSSGSALQDAEFVGLSAWEITRKPIESIDFNTRTLRLRGPHFVGNPFTLPLKGHSCYLENSPDFLTGPGQWSLERSHGTIIYWPRSGERMESTEVIAPVQKQLLIVRGTPTAPVRNLHFAGLEFAHTDWPLPPSGFRGYQAAFNCTPDGIRRVDEVVRFEFARDCTVRHCRFGQLGGGGLGLGRGCVENQVAGNVFYDIGSTAVLIGEDKDPDQAAEAVINNTVANNLVTRAGMTYFGAVGIWVGLTEGTAVEHNRVSDLPYTGISVGWKWNTTPTACKGNRIEFNKVADVMKTLKDGGGIYTLGLQPGTVIRGNLMERVGGYGALYLDVGSSGFMIESNVIRDTWTPIRFNSQRQSQTWGFNFFDAARTAPGKVGQGLQVTRQSFARGEYRATAETNSFAVTAWVKPQKLAQQTYVFSKGKPNQNDEFTLLLHLTKLVGRLNLGGGAANQITVASADGLIRPNVWHHVALTFGEQTLRLYLNGELVAEHATEKVRRPTNEMIGIGTVSSGTTGMLDGTIDEVRLYKRVLTAAEIATQYREPASLPGLAADPDLISLWDFEELTDPGPAQSRIVNQAGLQEPYRTQFGE